MRRIVSETYVLYIIAIGEIFLGISFTFNPGYFAATIDLRPEEVFRIVVLLVGSLSLLSTTLIFYKIYRNSPSFIKQLVLRAMVAMTLVFFLKLFTTSAHIQDFTADNILNRYFYDLTFLMFLSSLFLFVKFGFNTFLAPSVEPKIQILKIFIDIDFLVTYAFYFSRSLPAIITGVTGPEIIEIETILSIIVLFFLFMILFLIMAIKSVSLYKKSEDERKRKGFRSLSVIFFVLSSTPIIIVLNLVKEDYNKILELILILSLIGMYHFMYQGFIKPVNV